MSNKEFFFFIYINLIVGGFNRRCLVWKYQDMSYLEISRGACMLWQMRIFFFFFKLNSIVEGFKALDDLFGNIKRC